MFFGDSSAKGNAGDATHRAIHRATHPNQMRRDLMRRALMPRPPLMDVIHGRCTVLFSGDSLPVVPIVSALFAGAEPVWVDYLMGNLTTDCQKSASFCIIELN